MNKCFLIGRLTKEVELKFTSGSGVAIATFGLAVDRDFKNAEGQKEVDFINVVCWKKLAENVANNLDKGRLVAVFGAIRTRNYQGQDGRKVYVTEVVADEVKFLDFPKDGQDKNPLNSDSGFMPLEDSEDCPF